MPPVLWHLEISHYNEKARWALDYKGVEHVRRAVTPALQALTARRLRAGRTVPILEMNGRAIGDSTKIIEEIERRWPEPPLYPADPEERSRALDMEDYFDEQCGHDLRRVLFDDNLAEPEKFLVMLYGADHPRIGLLKTLSPVFCQVVKRRFRIRPETVEESREMVRAAFDKLEADVGPSGYLVGESFTVADLTAASILCPSSCRPSSPTSSFTRTSAPPSFGGSATRSRTVPGSSGSRTCTHAIAGRAPRWRSCEHEQRGSRSSNGGVPALH